MAMAMLPPFAIELYICSAAWVPSGAYAYGARRLSDCAPLLGLGVALAWAAAADAARWKRRLVAGSTIFAVVLCLFTMEMQRNGKARSSGGNARTMGMYLADAGAPLWAVRAGDAFALPFTLPAAIPYAIWWRAPLSTWDGVVGNFLLDRDGQWFTTLTKAIPFNWDFRAHIVSGVELDPAKKMPARVTGPVRLLPFMFASEPIGCILHGQIPEGSAKVTWNGKELPVRRDAKGIAFDAPKEAVRAATNDVRFEFPPGTITLSRLECESRSMWWRR
jgi:hypothetical protein